MTANASGVIETTLQPLTCDDPWHFRAKETGTPIAQDVGMGTRELLGVTTQQALQFFYERLLDVSDEAEPPSDELLYNSSVLAHFATTSVASDAFPACPSSLATVFDLYVIDRAALAHDPEIFETAAAQILLLTGFFQDQQKQRHQIEWYAGLGSAFFAQAARLTGDPQRGRLMAVMARRFAFWRERQHQLAIELRESPLLITSFRDRQPPLIM